MTKAITFRASSLGDALMGKYFLENVHAFSPDSRFFMFVGSRGGMIRELLSGYPWLTVIEANRKKPQTILDAWRILKGSEITLTQVSEKHFSTPSKLFARLVTKSGGLAGFEDGFWGNAFLYDIRIPFTGGERESRGIVTEERKALAAFGIPISISEFSLSFPKNDAVSKFSLTPNQYALLHLFSGNEGRDVSPEKRKLIVRELRKVLPADIAIVLTGGPGDVPRATDAANGLPGVMVLAGETTITELINLIANARVVMGLNTGAAHIAAHLKRPLVVLSQEGGKNAWWGKEMYGGVPIALCNESVDDKAPRERIYPPTLDTIDIDLITRSVMKFV